ncbi:ATP-binding protein [Lentzea kentuckyensis]|uniref:ATP-binding protein n=1 Tax=Lentzea kentuckyensis TaxID=360086 RepID=UPI000A36354C|nr:ATP-binding protein [Lentzea kentuckyensis]
MLDNELAEIVDNLRALGSDVADVEVKRAAEALPRTVRETLSAFANTGGGTLILGLEEATGFSATGVSNPAKMAADLASLCSTDLQPELRPLIKIHEFEGAKLVVAEVPAVDPALRPCFYRGAGITQGSFVRVGDGDRRLSSYEVQLMLASRGQPKDDEQPVPGVGVDALDQALTDIFVARLRTNRPHAFKNLDREDVLRRAKVVAPGADEVSLAGLLALGEYPQEHFPQLMLTFVHYPTVAGADLDTGERFLDNVLVEGPIPIMVRDALNAIRRNMRRRSVVVGVGRTDMWEYPEPALREAVVNALVHRDLSSAARGTQVQVEMYPDRLVVRNPGGLHGPVTVDSLANEGISSARNATLMKILDEVPIADSTRTVCENRGSGIRTMLDSLRAARMSPPQFDDRVASFTVMFPNHTLLSDSMVSWIASLGQRGLSDSQCFALASLKNGEVLDNRTYRAATGVDSRVATAELQDLVARELVVQTGSRRWARYQLSDAPKSEMVKHRALRADRRDEILAALGDELLSRAEIAARLELPDGTVRRWLTVLKKEGSVATTGGSEVSRNVKYRRTEKSYLTDDEPQELR